jgi:hypothetical protein
MIQYDFVNLLVEFRIRLKIISTNEKFKFGRRTDTTGDRKNEKTKCAAKQKFVHDGYGNERTEQCTGKHSIHQ